MRRARRRVRANTEYSAIHAGYWVMPTWYPATMLTMNTPQAANREASGAVRHHQSEAADASTRTAAKADGSR